MLQTINTGIVLIALRMIPLAFLLYTISHLEQLGIDLRHPRVVVELLIFVGLLIVGLILWFNQPII